MKNRNPGSTFSFQALPVFAVRPTLVVLRCLDLTLCAMPAAMALRGGVSTDPTTMHPGA